MKCDFRKMPDGRCVCQRCGHSHPATSHPPERIFRTCNPGKQPPIMARAAGYARAIAKWETAGRPQRTDAEVDHSWSEFCQPCEMLVNGKCTACGCPVKPTREESKQAVISKSLLNKLRMGTEHCPIGKWGMPKRPESQTVRIDGEKITLAQTRPRESTRLVVTAAVGPHFCELLAISGPLFADYATKCGADYRVISDVHSEYKLAAKFLLPQMFDAGYREVLFLDTDIVLMPNAPNIFEIDPKDDVLVHDDWSVMSSREWLLDEYTRLREELGIHQQIPNTCYNTGVVLMREKARDLFAPPSAPFTPSHTAEQSVVNLAAARSGLRIGLLPREWNEQWWPNRRIVERCGTYAYHWANAPHSKRVRDMAEFAQRVVSNTATSLAKSDIVS